MRNDDNNLSLINKSKTSPFIKKKKVYDDEVLP